MLITIKFPTNLFLVITIFILFSCQNEEEIVFENEEIISALPTDIISPSDNPYSEAKFELGQSLFWDPILSGMKDISCATCHHPDFGYGDGRSLSSGINGEGIGPNRIRGTVIKRNAPTIINTAFNGIDVNGNYTPSSAPMFWDNRASGLEEQALLPILDHDEMRGPNIAAEDILDTIVNRLSTIPAYVTMFSIAFGDEMINEDRLSKALATFQRNIVANNSRFDQYANGNVNALSNAEIRGMNTFIDVGCANCHSGPMMSDYQLHTLSVPENPLIEDDGATGNFDFRTPTLRNLNFTAPYMHNGAFNNLRDVLRFYADLSRGNGESQNQNVALNQIARDARNLRLGNGEAEEIIVFLNTLNDENFDKTIPNEVPSGLSVGGNID